MDLAEDLWLLSTPFGRLTVVFAYFYLRGCDIQRPYYYGRTRPHVRHHDAGLDAAARGNLECSYLVPWCPDVCHSVHALLLTHYCYTESSGSRQDRVLDLVELPFAQTGLLL